MSTQNANITQVHSASWIAQTWICFVASVVVTAWGIFNLPVDVWIKSFLGMGLLFSISSAISLAKTQRDLHEAQRLSSRIDEARLHRLITEHDPLSPPV
jgi:hypothetical protein